MHKYYAISCKRLEQDPIIKNKTRSKVQKSARKRTAWPRTSPTFVNVPERAKGESYKKAIGAAFCIPGYYQPLINLHTWLQPAPSEMPIRPQPVGGMDPKKACFTGTWSSGLPSVFRGAEGCRMACLSTLEEWLFFLPLSRAMVSHRVSVLLSKFLVFWVFFFPLFLLEDRARSKWDTGGSENLGGIILEIVKSASWGDHGDRETSPDCSLGHNYTDAAWSTSFCQVAGRFMCVGQCLHPSLLLSLGKLSPCLPSTVPCSVMTQSLLCLWAEGFIASQLREGNITCMGRFFFFFLMFDP